MKSMGSGEDIFVSRLNIFTHFSLLFILAMRKLAAEGFSSVGAFRCRYRSGVPGILRAAAWSSLSCVAIMYLQ